METTTLVTGGTGTRLHALGGKLGREVAEPYLREGGRDRRAGAAGDAVADLRVRRAGGRLRREPVDVAVTVTGGSFSGFYIGKAFATATLVAPSGTDSDAREITIGF
jgi:hypothetical protein